VPPYLAEKNVLDTTFDKRAQRNRPQPERLAQAPLHPAIPNSCSCVAPVGIAHLPKTRSCVPECGLPTAAYHSPTTNGPGRERTLPALVSLLPDSNPCLRPGFSGVAVKAKKNSCPPVECAPLPIPPDCIAVPKQPQVLEPPNNRDSQTAKALVRTFVWTHPETGLFLEPGAS
jgi:hypothetical protein